MYTKSAMSTIQIYTEVLNTPLNNGQNYGDRECPVLRGFTVYTYNKIVYNYVGAKRVYILILYYYVY